MYLYPLVTAIILVIQLLEKEIAMSIGERIKAKRKQSKLTQTELGKLVNVSSQVISNWERGYSEPNHDDVARLAIELDCSTEYLHGISSGKPPSRDILVAGKEISLSIEELELFNELKKHPVMFHDLTSDPEKSVKELLQYFKMKKMFLEDDSEEYGDGFGDLKD